jgi:hypothetical protein
MTRAADPFRTAVELIMRDKALDKNMKTTVTENCS